MKNFILKKGFTLIELLIVVAIIAILAAIAVPNFLEAQTRSKVSRCKADMRSIALAVEMYHVDNNKYPPNAPTAATPIYALVKLSTPIAYITNPLLPDPFIPVSAGQITTGSGGSFAVTGPIDLAYQYSLRGVNASGAVDVGISGTLAGQEGRWWLLRGFGPDGDADAYSTQIANNDIPGVVNKIYDPSNGTISDGNIYRVGGAPQREAGKLLLSLSSR